jgi:hypothetical protein
MEVIDLRQLGPISASAEVYLATLIANACGQDKIKHYLSLCARQDFGWDNTLLGNYVLANLMTESSTRVGGFISSGEWLCGIFTSGENLSLDHMIIMMSYVNPYVSSEMVMKQQYRSGKDIWKQAPVPIKDILDLLDDSIINGCSISVKVPVVEAINPVQSINTLEYLPLNELHDRVKITWS